MNLPLRPAPEGWIAEFNRLITNPWLARKTDRIRRIREQREYLDRYIPEISREPPGLVIDVGPGPGELLEICRSFGHDVLGIDAPNGRGGMGDDYLELSRLMTVRQEICVRRSGFEAWVDGEHQTINGLVALINFRGSIEQAFWRYMTGDRHDLHHDCKRLSWSLTAQTRERLDVAFRQMYRMLRTNGAILIAANGSANDPDYDRLMLEAGKSSGLVLVRHEPHLLHKWRRP